MPLAPRHPRLPRPTRSWPLCAIAAAVAGWVAPLQAALQWEDPTQTHKMSATDTVLETRYTFVNTGSTTVGITNVAPGCSCVAVQLPKAHFAPGEKGAIPVRFTPGARSGTESQRITVFTDDSPSPITLTLVVDIPTPVKLEPRYVFWKTTEPREPRTVAVELLADSSLRIGELTCGNPDFKATLVPVPGSDRQFSLIVTPPATGASFSAITLRVRLAADERTYSLLARTF